MEIGNIKKDEIPLKNKAMSQSLVFVEKCVPKKFCDEYYGVVCKNRNWDVSWVVKWYSKIDKIGFYGVKWNYFGIPNANALIGPFYMLHNNIYLTSLLIYSK